MTTDTRPDLPLGFTRDKHGNVLTSKASTGDWYKYTRDEHGRELTFKDSDGYWYEYTRDENGRELTYKNSAGYWHEYTYDEHGNGLTYKSSDGGWREYTRDEHGSVLTYKDNNGTGLCTDGRYWLVYDEKAGLYSAGCRNELTADQALKHWDRADERAVLFAEAISKNEKRLGNT